MADTYHVTPNNDLKAHNTNGDYCACKPRIEKVEGGGRVVVHNSYDGREFYEISDEKQYVRMGKGRARAG